MVLNLTMTSTTSNADADNNVRIAGRAVGLLVYLRRVDGE
jgi:hypothetical protein